MKKLKRKEYEILLQPLQLELANMANWVGKSKSRVVVIFEGRDTAGKGVIDALSEHVNPRQCRVMALPKPNDREATQWYFQRYIAHLPAAGEIVLMDRSWYNRAGVEKVMGFCTDAQYKAFLEQAPVFEKLLADDGILLFKYWLCCDQDKQEERFAERLRDPLKGWKLSPIDLDARTKYDEYTHARTAMLKATHTPHAPWTLVDFNDQKRGRLTLIRDLLDRLPETEVREAQLDFPPLANKPTKERYGTLKPLKPYAGEMIVRFALAIVPLLLASLCANAQDTATPASATQAANAAIDGPKQDDHTATMDTIQVTAKRPDTVDLYKFKNPIDPHTTEFSKDYHEPPSPQEISENGGILPYAVGYLLGKLGDAAKSLPNWKTNQARNAHPPPLTDAQLQRATQLQQQGQPATQNPASAASGSAPAQ